MNNDIKGALAGLPAGTAGHVDHIGIAVADLDQGLALYRDLLGLELERIEEVPQENVRVAFLKLDRQGGPGHIELLAPLSEAGAIAAFIAKRGAGLHHVAVAASDVAVVLDRCREAGIAVIDQAPRRGAGGKQVAFVHPRGTGGVLLEICGPAPADPVADPGA
jgi:methylmalonyl-CoA/ethylmalonyl-CoA epimerase